MFAQFGSAGHGWIGFSPPAVRWGARSPAPVPRAPTRPSRYVRPVDLADAADRARHDLGRYVCFQARGLDDDAPAEAWREALVADLRRTRSGPSGTEDVRAVWARVREPLLAAGVAEVDPLVADLASRADRLEAMSLLELKETAARARALADTLRAMARRLGA